MQRFARRAGDGQRQRNCSSVTDYFSGGKYGVSGSNSGHVTANADMLSVIADDGWSVCLFSGATANFTAKQAQFYEDLYVKASEMNAFADKMMYLARRELLKGA